MPDCYRFLDIPPADVLLMETVFVESAARRGSPSPAGCGNRREAQVAGGAKSAPSRKTERTRPVCALGSEVVAVLPEDFVHKRLAADGHAVAEVTNPTPQDFLQRQFPAFLDDLFDFLYGKTRPQRSAAFGQTAFRSYKGHSFY